MNEVELVTLEQIVLGLPFLGDLPKEEIGSLIQTLRLRHYPADTVLFNEGDPAYRWVKSWELPIYCRYWLLNPMKKI
jgi:hypothetical protein